MAKRVSPGVLGDLGRLPRRFQRLRYRRVMNVMAPNLSGARARPDLRCRKNVLPAEFVGSARVLAFQGVRQIDRTEPGRRVLGVQPAHVLDVMPQWFSDRRWQHDGPILCPLAVAHHDDVAAEVDVLDAQRQSFSQAQAGPIQQGGNHPVHAVHGGQVGKIATQTLIPRADRTARDLAGAGQARTTEELQDDVTQNRMPEGGEYDLRDIANGLGIAYGSGASNAPRMAGEILQAPAAWALEKATALGAAISDKEDDPGRYAARVKLAEDAAAYAKLARDENYQSGNAFADVGRKLEGVGKDAADYYRNNTTVVGKEMNAINDAKGFWPTLAESVRHPLGILGTTAQSAPDMVAGMGYGSIAAKLAAGIAERAGQAAARIAYQSTFTGAIESAPLSASRAAADQAARAAARTALTDVRQGVMERVAGSVGLVTEAVQSGAQNDFQVRDKIAAMDIGQLKKGSSRFRALLADHSPEEARTLLAHELGNESNFMAAVWNGSMSHFTGAAEAMGKTVTGGKVTLKDFFKNVGKETADEMLQNPGENWAQHAAQVQADPTDQYDFGGSVAQGLTSGGAMGLGMHAPGYISSKIQNGAPATAARPMTPETIAAEVMSTRTVDEAISSAAAVAGAPVSVQASGLINAAAPSVMRDLLTEAHAATDHIPAAELIDEPPPASTQPATTPAPAGVSTLENPNAQAAETQQAGTQQSEAPTTAAVAPISGRVDLLTLTEMAIHPERSGNSAFALYRPVDTVEAERLSALIRSDVSGFVHGADEAAIRHILRQHGDSATEEARGQIAVTRDDFARLPEITNPATADGVDDGGLTNDGLPTIKYSKRYNGYTYVVEEVRDGRQRLALKTMWKVRAVPRTTSGEGVAHTSETSGSQPPTNQSIAQPVAEPGTPPALPVSESQAPAPSEPGDGGAAPTQDRAAPAITRTKAGKLEISGFTREDVAETLKTAKIMATVTAGQDGRIFVTAAGRSGNPAPLSVKQQNAIKTALMGKEARPKKARGYTGNLRNDVNLIAPGLYVEVARGGDGEGMRVDMALVAERLRGEGFMLPRTETGKDSDAVIEIIRQDIANGGGTLNEARMTAAMTEAETKAHRADVLKLADEYGIPVKKGIIPRALTDIENDLAAAIENGIGVAGRSASSTYDAAIAAGIPENELDAIIDRIAVGYTGATSRDVWVKQYREQANAFQEAIDADQGREGRDTQDEGAGDNLPAPQGSEERPALELAGQTAAEARAEIARQEAAEAQRLADEGRAAAAERQTRIDAEVVSRQEIGAANFTLDAQTSDQSAQRAADKKRADDQLAGQGDIFSEPKTVEQMTPADHLRAAADKMDAAAKPKESAIDAEKVGAGETAEFIMSPEGSIDFGEITPEQGIAMKRQAGKIRLMRGVQNPDGTGYGLVHKALD